MVGSQIYGARFRVGREPIYAVLTYLGPWAITVPHLFLSFVFLESNWLFLFIYLVINRVELYEGQGPWRLSLFLDWSCVGQVTMVNGNGGVMSKEGQLLHASPPAVF